MAAPVLAISGLRTLCGRGALSTMARTSHGRGRERRLRQRLFNAGNTKCPLCLADFDRSDVLAGTNVTLEHAPPKSLGGTAICLTCKSCNNNASLIDQHAYQSAKARHEWAEGKGAPIVVDLFGHKRSRRFIPDDPSAPFPARKHLFLNGTIELVSCFIIYWPNVLFCDSLRPGSPIWRQ